MTTITYKTLLAEINKLVAQIDQVHVEEVVIQDIRDKVKAYGLTAADLGLVEQKQVKIVRRRKPEVKFRNPESGASWTGRGKLPKWIKESGKTKEDFLVC